ncbi:isopentenyl-diphosphate Delta-isomerase [Acidimangrovimonas sediminis]|uniref:isopentenyl-diphosphate Delta-isomerase n=1 Tax=Acidimangrovimonas sediminis TaxID=2056283 RepID=UPI000C7FA2FE|nr:isopentenyl-diphosphate Delta-isomerase [Acidimangrovimonas sediminis]
MEDQIPAWVNGTLMPRDKLEVHRAGLRHMAVSVFVIDGDKTLIQRRAMAKYHTPGLWANSCCTHPRWEEDPVDCAVRRLREELGLSGLYPNHRDRVEYRADVGSGMVEHEVVDIYIAYATPGMQIAPNPDEVMDTRWIELHDLCAEVERHPARFTPWLQIYMREHKSRIFGTLVRC